MARSGRGAPSADAAAVRRARTVFKVGNAYTFSERWGEEETGGSFTFVVTKVGTVYLSCKRLPEECEHFGEENITRQVPLADALDKLEEALEDDDVAPGPVRPPAATAERTLIIVDGQRGSSAGLTSTTNSGSRLPLAPLRTITVDVQQLLDFLEHTLSDGPRFLRLVAKEFEDALRVQPFERGGRTIHYNVKPRDRGSQQRMAQGMLPFCGSGLFAKGGGGDGGDGDGAATARRRRGA